MCTPWSTKTMQVFYNCIGHGIPIIYPSLILPLESFVPKKSYTKRSKKTLKICKEVRDWSFTMGLLVIYNTKIGGS